MTNYEQEQYDAIKKWQAEEPGIVSQAMGVISKPFVWLAEQIIPQKAIEGALSGASGLAQWLTDVDDIKRDGNVNSISDLRYKDLELSDKLANEVHNWAIGIAATEGGVAGATGLPGMIADIPAIVTQGLRVIYKIGICYGFEPKSEEDKNFVLGIMSAAGANTMQEKNMAVLLLKQIGVMLTKTAWKNMAQKGAVGAAVIALKNLVKQIGINLTKRKALQAIPGIGAAVGATMNAQFINDIAWAARRSFQERWLRDNGRLGVEDCEYEVE